MSVSFASGSINNLKDRIDIVDVIGQAVQLKRAGAYYKGLCPFHNEKTPSFMVSQSKQNFVCYGCGVRGDVIEFVMHYYNLSFLEAVEKLADEHGIKLEIDRHQEDLSEYYEINRQAARFFYSSFVEKANPGYSYMRNRGISDRILKKFGIGYADSEWDSLYRHLTSQGFDEKKLEDLGLVNKDKRGRYFDKFRNRVIFPILDTRKKVIGFGGRAIQAGDEPKYLNSPESKVFKKKNNLYGLNFSLQEAGKQGYLILVEGYMDVISVYQAGIQNVAASLGTALTEQQAALIDKRGIGNVVLSYDADQAGRKAALRGGQILRSRNLGVRILHVNDGKDPDEYINHNGKNAFLDLVDHALSYPEYLLETAKNGLDLSQDEERLEFVRRAMTLFAELTPTEQVVFKQRLAREAGIAESAIERELQSYEERRNKGLRREDRDRVQTRQPAVITTPLERSLIKLVMTDAGFVKKIRETMQGRRGVFLEQCMELAEQHAGSDGVVDDTALLEDAGEYADVLTGILERTKIDVDSDRVFRLCMLDAERIHLEEQEKQINSMLARVRGEDEESVGELMDRLRFIQNRIQLLRNREHEGEE